MKRRSLLTYIALFSISLAIATSCTNRATYITTTTDTSSSTRGSSAAASLGFSAWPGWFPWQVAQEQKIFEANKASVALKWFDGYLESLNTLTAQQINASSQTLNDTLSAMSGGADQVIVLVNDQFHRQ